MGNLSASETEKPDREPEEPAQEIFALANNKEIESGQFWYKGGKTDW
jgi:hypothetical protein